MKNILIIDDSENSRAAIKQSLTDAGYCIVGETRFGTEAIALTKKLKPDVILLDSVLRDMFGIDVLMQIKKQDFDTKVIMTGTDSQNQLIEIMMNLGASDFVLRPCETNLLVEAVNNLSDSSLVA